jgi:hypothetical protein
VSPSRSELTPETAVTWQVVEVMGVLFLAVGGWSLFSPLFPLNIGRTEWEFGTASSFFDTVPIFGLGLGFLLTAGLAMGRRWQVRVVALACVLLALLLWLAAGLYATVVPQAFNAAPTLNALTALKKGALKAAFEILVYPVGFIWIGIWAWRRTVSRR